MFDQFFDEALKLRDEGIPFATATVVRAEKPTSGKPGDKAIITLDGVMRGWIGGSCAQPTVVKEALRCLADDRSRLVRLSPDPATESLPEGMEVAKMTCYSGGSLDIYIEPQAPRPCLRIAGHLPVAQALARLAKGMGYRVDAVVTPGEQASMAHADSVATRWNELGKPASPLTYIVVATHGHHDEEALEYALESGAAYVGLVASPKRGRALRDYLKIRGLGGERLAPLKAPAGLDIGAERGDEIALSILAEIVHHRRSERELDWAPFTAAVGDAEPDSPTEIPTAIDPICGMSVVIEGARHTATHGDRTYYFCCGGCVTAFLADPEVHLEKASAEIG